MIANDTTIYRYVNAVVKMKGASSESDTSSVVPTATVQWPGCDYGSGNVSTWPLPLHVGCSLCSFKCFQPK